MHRSHLLITGGCGFIGSNIATSLAADGYAVTCMDNLSRRGSEHIVRHVKASGCGFVHGDIRLREDFAKITDKVDLLIDCSAEPSVLAGTTGAGASNLLNINVGGSINIFSWCQERGIPVIFLSTSRVYPHSALNALEYDELDTRYEPRLPVAGLTASGITEEFPLGGRRSMYGASKLCAELILGEYCASFGMHAYINRCGVVAGPWQMGKTDQGFLMYWLIRHHFRRELRYIGFYGSGKQVRDVLHVNDLVDLVKLQIGKIDQAHGQIYNVGGSRKSHCSLTELTDLCREVTGKRIPIAADAHDRPDDVRWYISDNTAVSAAFGWQPQRSLRGIVEDSHSWLMNHSEFFTGLI